MWGLQNKEREQGEEWDYNLLKKCDCKVWDKSHHFFWFLQSDKGMKKLILIP